MERQTAALKNTTTIHYKKERRKLLRFFKSFFFKSGWICPHLRSMGPCNDGPGNLKILAATAGNAVPEYPLTISNSDQPADVGKMPCRFAPRKTTTTRSRPRPGPRNTAVPERTFQSPCQHHGPTVPLKKTQHFLRCWCGHKYSRKIVAEKEAKPF